MKYSTTSSIAFLIYAYVAIFSKITVAQTIPSDSLYFGQSRPGNMPQIFAPGRISLTGRTEYGITVSRDGKEMLFAIGNWPNKRTMIIEYKNNHWTSPDTVSFSKTRSAEEAIYSPNGQRVYYYAYNSPVSFGGADLCYSEKIDSVWSEPINLGTPLNTSGDEYHPCVVADGSIFFENSPGRICYSKYENGAYQPRIILPSLINTNVAYGNPYVAPDESYFIFNSTRAGGFGGNDLYISYKKSDGSWTNPKNPGNVINTPFDECGSEITPDTLYMTFVSNNDIYWVSTSFIDSLRHTNFKPYVNALIPDQKDTVGQLYTYTLPASIFIDDDGNHTLMFSATLSNGSSLPSWLSFDSLTGSFSGIPAAPETLNIRVTATDTAMVSVSDIFKLTIVPQPIHVDDDHGSIPNKLRLYPNYPNPFNPSTTIEFSLPANQFVSLKIYNSVGQLVTTLLDQAMNPGRHQVQWNAADQASGVYMYCLRTGNNKISRKLLLLK